MSILAAIALAASGATQAQCSWDKPGVDPFMGDVVAAVDRYKDIPAATREKLKARMQARSYDEIVSITRDAIKGKAEYASDIRAMHFGAGSVCGTVTRAKWTDQMLERGLVYCEDGQCILVPTVCRNVSRITRNKPAPTATAARREGDDPQSLLDMEPTGAGVPAAGAPAAAPDSFAQIASAQPTGAGVPAASFPGIGGGAVPPSSGLVFVPSLPPGSSPTADPDPVTPTVPTVPEVPTVPTVPQPVPEPETWALMLLGLAIVGWAARRRRA
jgi:PEP-CTERM motif